MATPAIKSKSSVTKAEPNLLDRMGDGANGPRGHNKAAAPAAKKMCAATDAPPELIHRFDGPEQRAGNGLFGLGKRRDRSHQLVQKQDAHGVWQVSVQSVNAGRVNPNQHAFSSSRRVTVEDFNNPSSALSKGTRAATQRLNADANRLPDAPAPLQQKTTQPQQSGAAWARQQAANAVAGVPSAVTGLAGEIGALPEQVGKLGATLARIPATLAAEATGGAVFARTRNPIRNDQFNRWQGSPTLAQQVFERGQNELNKTLGADAQSVAYKAAAFAAPMLLGVKGGKAGRPGAPGTVQPPLNVASVRMSKAANGMVQLSKPNGATATMPEVAEAVAAGQLNAAHLRQAGLSPAKIKGIMKRAQTLQQYWAGAPVPRAPAAPQPQKPPMPNSAGTAGAPLAAFQRGPQETMFQYLARQGVPQTFTAALQRVADRGAMALSSSAPRAWSDQQITDGTDQLAQEQGVRPPLAAWMKSLLLEPSKSVSERAQALGIPHHTGKDMGRRLGKLLEVPLGTGASGGELRIALAERVGMPLSALVARIRPAEDPGVTARVMNSLNSSHREGVAELLLLGRSGSGSDTKIYRALDVILHDGDPLLAKHLLEARFGPGYGAPLEYLKKAFAPERLDMLRTMGFRYEQILSMNPVGLELIKRFDPALGTYSAAEIKLRQQKNLTSTREQAAERWLLTGQGGVTPMSYRTWVAVGYVSDKPWSRSIDVSAAFCSAAPNCVSTAGSYEYSKAFRAAQHLLGRDIPRGSAKALQEAAYIQEINLLMLQYFSLGATRVSTGLLEPIPTDFKVSDWPAPPDKPDLGGPKKAPAEEGTADTPWHELTPVLQSHTVRRQ